MAEPHEERDAAARLAGEGAQHPPPQGGVGAVHRAQRAGRRSLRLPTRPSVVRVAWAAADFGDAADAVDRAAAEHPGVNGTDPRILAAVRLSGPVGPVPAEDMQRLSGLRRAALTRRPGQAFP